MNNKLLELDYLRSFATLSLVIWHCFFCPMAVWGIIEDIPPIATGMLKIGYHLIPDANMPLFTFLSGYLFFYLYYEAGKYRETAPFITNKVKRLFIPFWVLGSLVILTSYNTHIERMIWGEGSHLWYCAMLFWCFMIAYWGVKINNIVYWVVVAGFSTVLVICYSNFWFMPFKLVFGIDNALYYISYFLFGGLFLVKGEILDKLLMNKVYLLFGAYFVSVCVFHLKIPYLSYFSERMIAYTYIIFLYYMFKSLVKKGRLKRFDLLTDFCKCSFGVYVFHHWIAWDLCWCPPLKELLIEHYLLFPTLLTLIVLPTSYFITKMALKTKVGKFLLV